MQAVWNQSVARAVVGQDIDCVDVADKILRIYGLGVKKRLWNGWRRRKIDSGQVDGNCSFGAACSVLLKVQRRNKDQCGDSSLRSE